MLSLTADTPSAFNFRLTVLTFAGLNGLAMLCADLLNRACACFSMSEHMGVPTSETALPLHTRRTCNK